MSALVVSLSALPDAGASVDCTLEEGALRPQGEPELGVTAVRVQGVLEPIGGEYLFRGALTGAYRSVCDRCLEPMESAFRIEAYWVFQHSASSELLDVWGEDDDEADERDEDGPRLGYVAGGEIDLAPLVWEELVLGCPAKFICREDCAGLCMACGANLNKTECGCQETQDSGSPSGGRGLAKLAEMFPDLKPKVEE